MFASGKGDLHVFDVVLPGRIPVRSLPPESSVRRYLTVASLCRSGRYGIEDRLKIRPFCLRIGGSASRTPDKVPAILIWFVSLACWPQPDPPLVVDVGSHRPNNGMQAS